MEDPAKVMVVVSMCVAVAYSVKVIASSALRFEELKRADRPRVNSEDRLARIEQAVDAIALEVERISEGQRFTTKLLSERVEKR